MRGIGAVGMAVSGLLVVAGGAVRAETEQKAAPAAPSAVERPAPRPLNEMEKLRETLRAKLDGTEWALELRPMEGTGKNKPDKVSFTGRTVTSERLAKLGYPASNYSLNVKEDRTATWETMQTKMGEGVAFWRGELEGETMRGVLSQQPANKPAENYSFVGKQSGGPTPKPEESTPATVAPAAAPQPEAPAVEPATTPVPQPEPSASPAPAPSVSAPAPARVPVAAQPPPAPAPVPAPEAPKKKKGWLW